MANKGMLKIQCFNGDDYIPVDGCRITVRGTPGTNQISGQMQGTNQGSMQGINKGLNQGSIQGTNQGSIQGTNQGVMQGFTQAPMQGLTQEQAENSNEQLIQGQVQGDTQFTEPVNIKLVTDNIGLAEIIELEAPPIEYSLNENSNRIPYSSYDIKVEREGFETLVIRGCQIFPEEVAYQRCSLNESYGRESMRAEVIEVQPNTLNGDYPPKIPEAVDKSLPPPSSGVVLAQPVVPEFITVHQGSPNDPSAPNYKVPYKDYIKNVASCEIYSTWPESTLRANIFCIISFTLNRIYTEWYRGKGKNFDVTSSTAYDHAFNYGRNIYDSISVVVDEIFSTYIRRIGKKQPLLTQYCDGKNVSCPQWLSQWGSKYLGERGKAPFEILTYYYGNDIELTTAEKVAGSPKSYPDYDLSIGSSGNAVKTIQEQLNRISQNYPLIPKEPEDGKFTEKTSQAVKTFQGVFNLPQTGVVDYATWYKISDVYVGVSKIAELRQSCEKKIFVPPVVPNMGDSRNIPKFSYYMN